MRRVEIDPISRLEGHGKISLFINDDGSATALLGGLGLEGISENLDTLIAN